MRTLQIRWSVRIWIVVLTLACTPVAALSDTDIENPYELIEALTNDKNTIDVYLSTHGVKLKQEYDWGNYITYKSEKITFPDNTIVTFSKKEWVESSEYIFIIDVDERDACLTAKDIINRCTVNFTFDELGTDESALRYHRQEPSYSFLYIAFYGKQVQCLRGIKLTNFEEFPCGFANSLMDKSEEQQREKEVTN